MRGVSSRWIFSGERGNKKAVLTCAAVELSRRASRAQTSDEFFVLAEL
jgi:hypothetical protein